MVELSREYSDRITYSERVVEIAWRRGSIEVNIADASVHGLRVYRNGKWIITSVQQKDRVEENIVESRAKKLVRVIGAQGSGGSTGYLVLGNDCSGSSKSGSPSEVEDAVELVKHIADNVGGGEIVFLAESTTRRIENDYTSCDEEKHSYEIIVYVERNAGIHRSIGSSSISFTGELSDAWRLADNLIGEASRRAEAGLRARKLGLLETGKWTIILDYDASGALFHELAHLLEGDQPGHLGVGERISTITINVYDDPLYPWSPATRSFDDEAVRAMRKPLVEDSEIVDLLHTRESAAEIILRGYDTLPGQARGLFHRPKAMHTTLIVGPGDWRVRELIEESKKAILVDGIIRAELYGQTVTIVPETTWLVDRELKEPVRIRAIRLPLIKALTTIDAMTRTSRLRHSYEKGHRVAEIAPMIRLQGVVEA